jgi:hypothetical protein
VGSANAFNEKKTKRLSADQKKAVAGDWSDDRERRMMQKAKRWFWTGATI